MARLSVLPVALALAAGLLSPARGADDVTELLKRAEAALTEGDPREAASLFRKARKLDPAVAPEADWGLARTAMVQGDHKTALALADALAREPASPDRLAAVLLLKGLVLSESEVPRSARLLGHVVPTVRRVGGRAP